MAPASKVALLNIHYYHYYYLIGAKSDIFYTVAGVLGLMQEVIIFRTAELA